MRFKNIHQKMLHDKTRRFNDSEILHCQIAIFCFISAQSSLFLTLFFCWRLWCYFKKIWSDIAPGKIQKPIHYRCRKWANERFTVIYISSRSIKNFRCVSHKKLHYHIAFGKPKYFFHEIIVLWLSTTCSNMI